MNWWYLTQSHPCIYNWTLFLLLLYILPIPGSVILDLVNAFLIKTYVPRAFKIALFKSLPKNTSLDPNEAASCRPISNFPFISKILEKVAATQQSNYLCRNNIDDQLHYQLLITGYVPRAFKIAVVQSLPKDVFRS